MKEDIIEEYHVLIKQLVNLQQKLIREFEATVKVVSLPSDFLDRFSGGKLKNIIKPEQPISQILHDWPAGIDWIPHVVWTRPRVGVMQLEGQNWLFSSHGTMEIQFISLPSELSVTILESLREGKTEALLGMPTSGPVVEASYREGGETDGVTAWSVYVFAQSIGSKVAGFSEAEHIDLLEALVKEGFLLRPYEDGPYYVLATE